MYKIKLKQGNVVLEDADFIVNPSNTSLLLGSGVSHAFRMHCGNELQKEMKKYAPIKKNEVVITPSFADNFKYALHVAIMDYSVSNPFPTYDDIKKALENIEKIIKKYAPCKMAIPLMGTGVGGLDKEKVAKIYKDFFKRKVDFDCEVIIYGYSKEDYELLKKVFKRNVLKIFTTSRQIRTWLENKDNQFIDKHYTLGEFLQKIIIVDGKKFIDKDLRKKYLFEAIKEVDVEKLGINKDFLYFFDDSEFIFDFFNELFLEKVDINTVKLNDVYLDYDEHLTILEEILKNYKSLLERDGYIDKFLIEDFRINEGLLEDIDKIEMRLDGYLSRFDIEVLSKINKDVYITFETDKFNLPLLEKSLKLKLKSNMVYEYKLKGDVREIRKIQNEPEIEVGYVSDRINQINYVFAKIMEFYKSGIKPEKIAVILPDEEFSEFLKLFDEKKNLNFAMGESFTKSNLYIKLKSIFEYLSGDEEALGKCEDLINEFEELDLIEFIKKIASNKELRVIEEELFKIEKFREFFKEKKEFLYFILERLKRLKFDDVYSGLVTCMGVLESRGMEFDGVIILDFNEGIVPNVSDSDLFLNTFVRQKSSLPTRMDKENLQKHYYYQLIKKAKRVAISFTNNEENSPSRFLYDLMPELKNLVNIDEKYKTVIEFKKEKEIAKYDEKFKVKFPLYPTYLKMLMECPKKYYFNKILEIVNEEEDEDEFFGNIFHESMKEVIKNKDRISSIDDYYSFLIGEITKRISDKKLLFDVFVKWDEKIREFTKKDFEEMKYSKTLPEKTIKFNYQGFELMARVDRIDLKENEVVLIDYKTSKTIKDDEKYPYELQTTFYYLWAKENFKDKKIKVVIWDIYNKELVDANIKVEILNKVLKNLPTSTKEAEDIVYEVEGKEKIKKASDICRYCEYKIACGRDE